MPFLVIFYTWELNCQHIPNRRSRGQRATRIVSVPLSSRVFKICGQQSVNVSYNLRFEVHCMQSVICSLQSAVCKCRHRRFGAKICSDICRRKLSLSRRNSFPRAELKENCQLRGTDNDQGQISELITHPLIFEWFYWLLYVTWCKSPDSYHAITELIFVLRFFPSRRNIVSARILTFFPYLT